MSRVLQGILQGVMTGVGFIGAGVIFRQRQPEAVRNLTTAATVWVTAALGVACALAAWHVVWIGVALALVVLSLGSRLERLGRGCWAGPRRRRTMRNTANGPWLGRYGLPQLAAERRQGPAKGGDARIPGCWILGRLGDALTAGGGEPFVGAGEQRPAGVQHHRAGLVAVEPLHVNGEAEVGRQVAAGRGLQHPVAAEAGCPARRRRSG